MKSGLIALNLTRMDSQAGKFRWKVRLKILFAISNQQLFLTLLVCG
jgi:hypothetical protein